MTSSKAQSLIEISRSASGEKRLTELGIALPPPPEPFGIYVDAVQRGNLLSLTGMFQTDAAKRNSSDASARSLTSTRGVKRHSLLR